MKKNKFKFFTAFVFASFFAFGPSSGMAVSLGFAPVDQTVDLQQQATVDVFASDLAATFVGAYDFFVDYDPAVLAFDTVTFGTALGGALDSLQSSVEPTAGSVNIAELSLIFDLSTLQDGVSDLLLFSIIFDAVSSGSTTLSFGENIQGLTGGFLGDETGTAIVVDSLDTGNITVSQTGPVPAPGSLALLAIGLAGVGLRRTRARGF